MMVQEPHKPFLQGRGVLSTSCDLCRMWRPAQWRQHAKVHRDSLQSRQDKPVPLRCELRQDLRAKASDRLTIGGCLHRQFHGQQVYT